jgi:hypothetical protein
MSNPYILSRPIPYSSGKFLKQSQDAVIELEQLLEKVTSLSDQDVQSEREQLLELVDWFLDLQIDKEHPRFAYFWAVLDDSQMPRDARTDFVYHPTCIVISIVFYLKQVLGLDTKELDRSISRCLNRIQRYSLWMGNGYDRYSQMIKHLRGFSKSGIISWVHSDSKTWSKINNGFSEVADSLVHGKDGWTGQKSGFHKISEEEYYQLASYLKPYIEKHVRLEDLEQFVRQPKKEGVPDSADFELTQEKFE